jgi:hypothetical protein
MNTRIGERLSFRSPGRSQSIIDSLTGNAHGGKIAFSGSEMHQAAGRTSRLPAA